MIFKLNKDPYADNNIVFKKSIIEINPGVTVLVGCNGSGKSTLLKNIESNTKETKTPCHFYNNLHDGGHHAISKYMAGFDGPMEVGVTLLQSSEGESISINIGQNALLYKKFLKTGIFDDSYHRLENGFKKIFGDNTKNDEFANSRILLFDAVDSGLSIDMVLELKELFELMLKDAKEMNLALYIIIAANEYELCNGEQCFDVSNGEYVTFADYEDFKKFIINSREEKNKRIAAMIKKEKRHKRIQYI